jgi:hypothetical protein
MLDSLQQAGQHVVLGCGFLGCEHTNTSRRDLLPSSCRAAYRLLSSAWASSVGPKCRQH